MARTKAVLVLVAACLVPAGAQDGRVAGPSLGYSVELSGVRPVAGIPGAALRGAAIDLGGDVSAAAASNAAGYVLAAAGDEGRVVLFTASAVALPGAMAAPDRIAVSPLGRAAVLYSSHRAALQVITGLPESPVVKPAVALPWKPDALAVSDRGAVLAAADGALWSVGGVSAPASYNLPGRIASAGAAFPRSPSRAAPVLVQAGDFSAISFFPDRDDAAFSDGASIWVRRGASITPLGEVAGAVAVRAETEFVFAAAGQSVIRFELSTGARTETACDFAPTALDPMGAPNVFRLNDAADAPLYLYEGNRLEPRVVFVPDAPEGGAR
mgnify:CR=1 FL=1